MESTPISRPGKTDGYVLVDAIGTIFLAALLAGTIVAGIGIASQSSIRLRAYAEHMVHDRNEAVLRELSEQP